MIDDVFLNINCKIQLRYLHLLFYIYFILIIIIYSYDILITNYIVCYQNMYRSIEADYDKEVSIYGLIGSRFVMRERTWFLNQSQCYCLERNKVPNCLPQGLIDVSDCLVMLRYVK